jgi:putative membrane protein
MILLIVLMLFAAIIIGGVWLIVGRPWRAGEDRALAAGGTAEQILAERLARGEIDPDEYRVRLSALREHGPRS